LEEFRVAGQATNDNVRHAIACLTRKAKNTHSEYVILTGFPLQKWMHERASMSRYTHIVCLVSIILQISLAPIYVGRANIFTSVVAFLGGLANFKVGSTNIPSCP